MMESRHSTIQDTLQAIADDAYTAQVVRDGDTFPEVTPAYVRSIPSFVSTMRKAYAADANVETIELQPLDVHRRGFVPLVEKSPPPVPTLIREVMVDIRHASGERQAYEVNVWAPLVPLSRELGEQSYIGWWMRQHYQRLAREYGIAKIAHRLKKQGIPCHVAMLILTGKTISEE